MRVLLDCAGNPAPGAPAEASLAVCIVLPELARAGPPRAGALPSTRGFAYFGALPTVRRASAVSERATRRVSGSVRNQEQDHDHRAPVGSFDFAHGNTV